MFSFNFVVDGDDIKLQEDEVNNNNNTEDSNENQEELRPAKLHLLTQDHLALLQSQILSQSKIDTISITGTVNSQATTLIRKVTLKVDDLLTQCDFASELKTTDLITGVYEGGFKLWECSIDVIKYLIDNKYDLKGKRVLECGCGHGLPGLYAIHQGAVVDFQDYNDEVIDYLTMANVLLCDQKEVLNQFYSGDWEALIELVPAQSYDLIVTSDTLYHTHSHLKLYKFMKHVLKPDGEVLVGAKKYYFGCGGGVHSFKQLVRNQGEMTSTTVREVLDGQSNVREIVSLRFN